MVVLISVSPPLNGNCGTCPLCNIKVESIIFRWRKSNLEGSCFSHFLGNLSEASNVFSLISVVGWAIWRARNDWIFNKVIPNRFNAIEFAVRLNWF